MSPTPELAEAIAELEAYDEDEARNVLDFVRALLTEDDNSGAVVK